MDPNQVLGWLLILLGVFLVIASLFQPFIAPALQALVAAPPPSLLKPVIELLKAIIDFFGKAPRGRVYLFVGVLLILAGSWVLITRPIRTPTPRIGVVESTRARRGNRQSP